MPSFKYCLVLSVQSRSFSTLLGQLRYDDWIVSITRSLRLVHVSKVWGHVVRAPRLLVRSLGVEQRAALSDNLFTWLLRVIFQLVMFRVDSDTRIYLKCSKMLLKEIFVCESKVLLDTASLKALGDRKDESPIFIKRLVHVRVVMKVMRSVKRVTYIVVGVIHPLCCFSIDRVREIAFKPFDDTETACKIVDAALNRDARRGVLCSISFCRTDSLARLAYPTLRTVFSTRPGACKIFPDVLGIILSMICCILETFESENSLVGRRSLLRGGLGHCSISSCSADGRLYVVKLPS